MSWNFAFLKVQLKKEPWRKYVQSGNPAAAALMSKMNYSKAEQGGRGRIPATSAPWTQSRGGEVLHGIQEVRGSIPLISTKKIYHLLIKIILSAGGFYFALKLSNKVVPAL